MITVYYIEDDAQTLNNTAGSLSYPDRIRALGNVSPEDGIEWLDNNSADLILLDYDFKNSDLDGADVMRILRKEKLISTPIILYTGFLADGPDDISSQEDDIYIVPKSVPVSGLRQLITDIVSGRSPTNSTIKDYFE